MKQKLLKTMLLLSALVAGSSSVWATDVTFTFNTDAGISELGISKPTSGNGTNLSTSPYTLSGVSMTATHGSTNTRVYNSSGTLDLRVYKSGGSLTFSAPANITNIVLAGSTVGNFSANVGTFSAGSWSGDAASVTLTATNTGKINTITVTYKTASVSSLSIKTAPTKTRYEVGETLDMSGFVLNADGEEKTTGYTMTMGGASISNGATLSSAGKKTITVAYGGKEVEQNISVGAVTGIAVTAAPTKTSYDTGDSFDPTGMEVTASLSTGELSDPDTWTKAVTGYTCSPTTALAPANTSVTITYATKTTTQAITVTDVAVTSVAVKSSTTIEVGKTETLTPTFEPANATNKNVTWESDDTDVATVTAAGVVTAVAAGTANITVTTEDGGKTATCVVTVVLEKGSIDAPYSVADVIDMSPSSTSSAAEEDVYVIGYIVGCCNTSTGAIITDPTKIHETNLALSDDPDDTSSHICVQLSTGDNRTNFNVLGNPHRVGSTKILIKADVFKYCGIAGLKNIDEMSTVAEVVKITDASGFATYASDSPLDFTGKDIDAYIAVTKGNGTGVTFTQVNKVPANTGLLIHYTGAKTEEIPVFDGTGAETVTSNKFVKGTGAAVATDGSTVWNYILNKVGGNIGFYKAAGQKVAKNRAYLSILKSESASIKEFISIDFEDDATSIQNSKFEIQNEEAPIYNLAGQRISKMQKGINIVNGKKVLF